MNTLQNLIHRLCTMKTTTHSVWLHIKGAGYLAERDECMHEADYSPSLLSMPAPFTKTPKLKPSPHGPQCNDCCPFCRAKKEEFVLPTFTGAELLTLADWIATSPVPEVLRLFKRENDIG